MRARSRAFLPSSFHAVVAVPSPACVIGFPHFPVRSNNERRKQRAGVNVFAAYRAFRWTAARDYCALCRVYLAGLCVPCGSARLWLVIIFS